MIEYRGILSKGTISLINSPDITKSETDKTNYELTHVRVHLRGDLPLPQIQGSDSSHHHKIWLTIMADNHGGRFIAATAIVFLD